MEENVLTTTNREIFYAAMALGYERVVGIEYNYPLDNAALERELAETKRALHKRKLFRETSKGEVAIAPPLSEVVRLCAEPQSCEIVREGRVRGVVYKIPPICAFVQNSGVDDVTVGLFQNDGDKNAYIANQIRLSKEESDNGATT